MDNKSISRSIRLLSQLQELHGENPFKIKATVNSAFQVDKLPYQVQEKSAVDIAKIPGIGQGMAAKIVDLVQTGTTADLEAMIDKTPEGIIEMLGIKGLGPKKIAVIWHDLGIENIGSLYYACNENRLVAAKGFGEKTQKEIIRLIEFKLAANGKFIYPKANEMGLRVFAELADWLNQFHDAPLLGLAGDLRRGLEIIEELTFVIGASAEDDVENQLSSFPSLSFTATADRRFTGMTVEGMAVSAVVVNKADFYREYFIRTGNAAHVAAVLTATGDGPFTSEAAIYEAAKLPFIEPELRENMGEIGWAKDDKLPRLIQLNDLKGTLHNHSTWSDGANTLEDMALYCKDVLKLEYLGISDHSKTAFYARGLKEDQVFSQHAEIDALNSKLAPFKIFRGIESDILGTGALDYSDEVLATFDFIVASVHTNLKMNEEKATSRLIKAIENPYTTILGHPTGRLLLSREGYPIDYKKVIDACAANGVIIEINANPLRLDLDWRWQRYALEKGVMLSINPDAHRLEGFNDMQFGILSGRKGGLTASSCLNAMTLSEITAYFDAQKSKR